MSKKEQETEDNIIFDDAEHAPDQIKKLKTELKETKAKCQEYLEGWQRDKADFVNARKRDEESQKAFKEFAKSAVIEDMLPVLDSFDMAMQNESWEKADETWRKGVEYIHSQLRSSLEGHGLIEENPIDEAFDPNKHDSVGSEEVPKKDEGKIVKVVQKGYRLGEKELRPARVIVGETT